MISAYKIKPAFQQLLKPLLNWFHKAGISANDITWTALLLSAVTGVLFWFFPTGICSGYSPSHCWSGWP